MKKVCEYCGINYTRRTCDHLCKECLQKLTQPRLCLCGCGKLVKSKDWRVKYISGHASKCEDIVQKRINTCISKYGIDNPSKCLHIREKAKSTCLKKYGVDNAFKNETIRNKAKNTLIQKYNVDHCSKIPNIQEKTKQTCLQKYRYEYVTQVPQFKDKKINTYLKHYGVIHHTKLKEFVDKTLETTKKLYGSYYPMDNPIIKQKYINTCISRYGVDSPFKCEYIKDKCKKTCLEKYGVDNFAKTNIFKYKYFNSLKNTIWERISTNPYWEPLFSYNDFNGWYNYSNGEQLNYNFKCRKCGNIQQFNYYFHGCKKCLSTIHRSKYEDDLYKILSNYNIDIEINNRNILDKKELDIYIPSKNIAIEFNGLYWHSSLYINDKKYHLNKTEKCLSKNIQLIHIFEDEWINKNDIVISRLNSLLGIYKHKIYARQCEIRKVNYPDSVIFLNQNHIQGNCKSLYRYGLYYNNELVSLMTFGNLRSSLGNKSTDNKLELLRFCNKLNYHIPGAASKLFTNFINENTQYTQIISYADRRWSKGNLYNKLGFTLDHISPPNYWYIINNKREHRYAWRKNVLKQKLKIYDDNLTEFENMSMNNYYWVYDCGNYVFIWNKL